MVPVLVVGCPEVRVPTPAPPLASSMIERGELTNNFHPKTVINPWLLAGASHSQSAKYFNNPRKKLSTHSQPLRKH